MAAVALQIQQHRGSSPFTPLVAAAVRALEQARAAGGKVYVHCTAGLGRSPAVAIASLYWFTDMQLDEAYAYLTRIRPCGPSKVRRQLHEHKSWCCFAGQSMSAGAFCASAMA